VGVDWKQRAVEQWTADPCGPEADSAEQLIARRREYAPWMAAAFDYAGARGLKVLDVGCGQGIDLCEYARAGADAVGIDLTPRHVELARKHLAELGLAGEVVLGDAETLPFADATFDRASSNGVLHHTPDIAAALREIRRVLKPGGRFTLTVYNRRSAHYWLHLVALRGIAQGGLIRERGMAGVLSSRVERSSIGARPLVRVYDRGEVASLLGGAGFADVRTAVSPFQAHETVPTRMLRVQPGLRVGWYVIGYGTRPPELESSPTSSA